MADNKPVNEDNSPRKWSNPFKKVLGDVKKLMKIEEKKEERKESIVEKPSTPEISKKRNVQTPESSKAEKTESSETKVVEKRKKTNKTNAKEQKLPKKYKKGW